MTDLPIMGLGYDDESHPASDPHILHSNARPQP